MAIATHCHGCDLQPQETSFGVLVGPRLIHPCVRCGSTGPGYCSQPVSETNHLCTADVTRLAPFTVV